MSFELNPDIIPTNFLTNSQLDQNILEKKNVPTNFKDNWGINERYIIDQFQEMFTRKTAHHPLMAMISTDTYIIWTNVLSKIHDDFDLGRDIFGQNVLTKFHADWAINMASGVFTG
ncbi:hypothetical protein DPMN_058838 [Dreissena polymorpha]|uniref:Uncharacterized protein n=1 Tax=Dreissena polymorpha TaxID=45954 RepID=A0A9D4HE72_DREPO|nr:hypothetical protein DPMN_058838 [Dreissena polymorpha]